MAGRQTRRLTLGLALAFSLCLGGCASLVVPALLPGAQREWPADLPEAARVAGVPVLEQADEQCGPTSLAMLLQWSGDASATPAQLAPQVYLPARGGSLQAELLGAARRAGRLPVELPPHWGAVAREIAAGHPVLVLENRRARWWPQWHYAVITGYDRRTDTVTEHDGRTMAQTRAREAFERDWAAAGHWAVVVLPPQQLPASATPEQTLAAAAVLERVRPAAAQQAYGAALARWPQALTALLGLGNVAYAQGDLPRAARAFEAATEAHPDAADAWNNLAQVQLELGERSRAQRSAERAVQLGEQLGLPRLAQYRATLESCVR